MIINSNLYRGMLTIICCLLLLLGYTTNAQAQCTVNAYSQPGSFNSGYVQVYVLTDLSGNIISITPDNGSTTAITTPANGSYILYALNYDPNNPPNPLPSVGGIISDVGSIDLGCFDSDFLSDCLLIECICDGEELIIGAESGSFNGDYTQIYVALDGNNTVVDTSSTGVFNFGPTGPYTIHALNYDPGNPPAPLPLGMGDDFNTIGSTIAGCYNIEDLFSEFICVAFSEVCEPECNPENAICLGDSICITAEPGSFNEDYEQWYLLTDSTGTIIEINTDLTGCFATGEGTNITFGGNYYGYAFNYDPNNPPIPLPMVGDDISGVGTVSLGCFNETDLLAERCCIIINEQCCPTVNVSEQALTTCDGDDSFDLATALADWQAMMTIATDPNMGAGTLVLSADSLDDVSFPTFPPTGIYSGDGCAADVQTWFAAYECDQDKDGQLDSYVYAGKFTLSIYAAPQAPTQVDVTQGATCSFSPVAACGDEDISMIADVDCGTAGGDATVTVTTADGCSADFTVTTPDCDACQTNCTLAAMLSTDPPVCDADNNLEYTVTVSGVQGNLSWDNGAAVVDNNDGTFTITVAPGSSLTVTFTDDNTTDCTAMVMIDATSETCGDPECTLAAVLSTDTPICDQNGNLEYIVTVSGAQGNLSWDNGSAVVDNNDGTFTITVIPGTTLTITFTDDIIGDCTAMAMIDATAETCNDPDCTLVAMLSIDAPICNQSGNLEYTVTINGVQGNLTWDNTANVVDNNDGTFTITVMPGTMLTVTFTDDHTAICKGILTIDATEESCIDPGVCSLVANLDPSLNPCNGDGNFEYTVMITGVQGNLTWDNATNVVDNNDGTYTITIAPGAMSTTTFEDDAVANCTAEVSIDASDRSCDDCLLDVVVDPNNINCSDDGSLLVTVSVSGAGGNISLSGLPLSTGNGDYVLSLLPNQIIDITVVDLNNGCEFVLPYIVPDITCVPALPCTLSTSIDADNVTCGEDGTLTADITVNGANGAVLINGAVYTSGNGVHSINLQINTLNEIIINDPNGLGVCQDTLYFDATSIICEPEICTLSAVVDDSNIDCISDTQFTASIVVSGAQSNDILINGVAQGSGNGSYSFTFTVGTTNTISVTDPDGIGDCSLSFDYVAAADACDDQEPTCNIAVSVDDSNIDCISDTQFTASIVVSGAQSNNILINGIAQGGGNGSYPFTFTVGVTNNITVSDPDGIGDCSISFDYIAAADACDDQEPTCNIVASVDPNNITCNDNNQVNATITVNGANGSISINGVDQGTGNGTYIVSVVAGASHTISITETNNPSCATSVQIDASGVNCTACTLGLSLDEGSFICDANGGFTGELTVSGATGNISINGVLQSGGDGTYSVNLTTGTNNIFTITDDTGITCTAIASFDAGNVTCTNPGEPPVPSGNCNLAAILDPNSFACSDDNSFTANLIVSNAIGLISINGQSFAGNGTYAVTLTTGSNNSFTIIDTGIGDCTATVNFDASDLSCTGVDPGNPPSGEPLPCNLMAVIDGESFTCMNDNQFSATVEISGANGAVLINSTLFPGNGAYMLTLNAGAVNGFVITDPAVQSTCEFELIFDATAYGCIGIISGEPPTIDECVFLKAQLMPECSTLGDTHNVTLEITGGVGPFTISGNQIQTTSAESTYSFQLVDFEDYIIDIEDANGCTFSLSGSFTSCITLSLELIEFTGEVLPQGNQLDWVTAVEQQVDYFQLEHSTDGINYELIHEATALGDNESINQYAYLHEKPATGLNYYRLVEVDDNGQSHVLQVITLIRTEMTNAITNIYPVPVTDLMQIEYNALETGQVIVNIYDVKGRLSLSRKAEVKVGNNQISLDLSEFTAGVYLLSIKNRGIVSTYKFSKD